MSTIETLYAQLETREDPATWLVLADALMEAGDVRGQLIQLQHARDPRAEALVREHTEQLVGFVPPAGVQLDWHMGHVQRARLRTTDLGERLVALRALLTHPGHRRLRHLTLDGPTDELSENLFRDLFARMAADGLVAGPTLRSLQLGHGLREKPGYWVYGYFGECRLTDELGGLWRTFPHLRSLRLDLGAAALELGEISAPELRDFEWVAPFLAAPYLAVLAAARWPQLERLVVWTGSEVYVNTEWDLYSVDPDEDEEGAEPYTSDETLVDAASLEPLLEHADKLPGLTAFGVANWAGSWAELADRMRAHAFWPRLTSLEMARGRVQNQDMEALITAISAVPGLQRVGIDHLQISVEALDELQRRLPAVTFDGQPEPGPVQERFYYVITQE
jgi:hypothetical protein